MSDTIVALATPSGRSGIGVIRLSGPDSLLIVQRLISDPAFKPEPRTAILTNILDPETGGTIDEALVTYFQAPHSFTGEDVVEISCHGSPVILRQIIDQCLGLNAWMAEAGEFSLRALANGRIDLSQAEAIRDLINAQTIASARQSARQLGGEVSHQLQPVKDVLLDVIVLLESALEFVEDDLPEFQSERVRNDLAGIAAELEKIASTFKAGRLLREGLRVALVGRPNVGKSSLFNALLGEDRAIVTEIAGTTRDQLHEKFTIDDIPISLIDTAGLRETLDTVEIIGVERSKRAIADADLVIVMIDGAAGLNAEDREIIAQVRESTHFIAVNKIDLDQTELDLVGESKVVRISAKTGEGLEDLKNSIVEPFSIDDIHGTGFLISDARHHDLLLRARSEIEDSILSLKEKRSEEIILIGLHNALIYLGQITGETTTEDMLTRIFSTFCIGK